MRKSTIKILKLIPITMFLSMVVINLIYIHLVTVQGCECGYVYKSQFLIDSIFDMVFIYFMYLVVKRTKLCYYNIVSVFGLGFMAALNIVAITTPLNYTMYNSIVTQTSLIGLSLLVIYLLIKKK